MPFSNSPSTQKPYNSNSLNRLNLLIKYHRVCDAKSYWTNQFCYAKRRDSFARIKAEGALPGQKKVVEGTVSLCDGMAGGQDNRIILYNFDRWMSVAPRRKESEIIEILFSNRKIDQLHDYLEQNPDQDLLTLTDNQDNTILHQLAYEGHLDIIKLFVKQIRQRLTRRLSVQKKQLYETGPQQEIKNWMDRQNNEGFTALLYACYSGHLDVIQYLVQQHKVNYQLTTKTGLNPFHLAAQKNMLMPLLYFRERIEINSRDQLNSSALHWAAYTNSEEVVAFMLAQPSLSCLDQRDNEGNTALMISVLYGNTRVVRRLLIKGADRYLANNENKTPMTVAKQNKFKTIRRMLNEEFTCCDMLKLYCNVKLEYKPSRRKYTYPLIFLFSFALNVALLNVLLTFVEWYSLYSQVVLFATMLVFYLTLLAGPPTGEIKDYDELIREKSQKNLKKMCFDCKNFVPRRGYHCDICKVCVQQYDHHCTWINNCVGKRNIGRFNFFLFFLVLSLGHIGIFSVLAQICIIIDEPTKYADWFQLRYLHNSTTERVCLGLMFLINTVTSLFIIPVLMLFVHQIRNLLKNKTTFQMLRRPQSEAGEIKEKMRKYNSNMSLRNCKMMCSDSKSSASSFNTTNEDSNQVFTSLQPSLEHHKR